MQKTRTANVYLRTLPDMELAYVLHSNFEYFLREAIKSFILNDK